MDQDIKLVFDAKKYPTLISFATQALNEKDSNKRYSTYLKVFQEMTKAYNQTKDPKQKQVMVELRNYSAINPAYKESDWVMPI